MNWSKVETAAWIFAVAFVGTYLQDPATKAFLSSHPHLNAVIDSAVFAAGAAARLLTKSPTNPTQPEGPAQEK